MRSSLQRWDAAKYICEAAYVAPKMFLRRFNETKVIRAKLATLHDFGVSTITELAKLSVWGLPDGSLEKIPCVADHDNMCLL